MSKSKKATASSNANTVFRFQDLPAELRNRIYELALTVDDKIRLTRHQDKDAHATAMKIWRAKCKGPRHMTSSSKPSMQYRLAASIVKLRGRSKQGALRREYGLGLLATSMTIYSEAHPIFFGHNSFIFEHKLVLEHLMKSHKGVASLLTDVELKDVDLQYDKDALSTFHDSTKLKSYRLVLNASSMFRRTLDELAENLAIAFSLPGPTQKHSDGCKWDVNDMCTCITEEQQRRRIGALDVIDNTQIPPTVTPASLEQLKDKTGREWRRLIEQNK